ncbi:hypothetical protein ACFW2Y_14595 [Streptomyces sp. NPDC058877]|uniref:hypothetical protein n=1 Tax=unclassified Streptomyces TaxID=2593676 RepID=UPI003690D807
MRRRTVAAALLGAVTLAACGIQETDVVEAGGAATVIVAPPPEFRMVLYFLGPDGRPVPVIRDLQRPFPEETLPPGVVRTRPEPGETGVGPAETSPAWGSGAVATDKVLAVLLAGPSEADASAGLTTGIPAFDAPPRVEELKGQPTTGGRRVVRLRSPFPVRDLSEAAVQQLVCTAVYAEDRGGEVDVIVMGIDGTLPETGCAV